MKREEVSGYVQIVIGLVGIVLTVLTSQTVIDALGALNSARLEPGLEGATQAIKLYCLMFILVCLLLLVASGLSTTLSIVAAKIGTVRPMLTSALIVAAAFSAAGVLTLSVLKINYWIAGFVGMLGLSAASAVSAIDKEGEWTAVISAIFVGLFLLTGLATVVANAR